MKKIVLFLLCVGVFWACQKGDELIETPEETTIEEADYEMTLEEAQEIVAGLDKARYLIYLAEKEDAKKGASSAKSNYYWEQSIEETARVMEMFFDKNPWLFNEDKYKAKLLERYGPHTSSSKWTITPHSENIRVRWKCGSSCYKEWMYVGKTGCSCNGWKWMKDWMGAFFPSKNPQNYKWHWNCYTEGTTQYCKDYRSTVKKNIATANNLIKQLWGDDGTDGLWELYKIPYHAKLHIIQTGDVFDGELIHWRPTDNDGSWVLEYEENHNYHMQVRYTAVSDITEFVIIRNYDSHSQISFKVDNNIFEVEEDWWRLAEVKGTAVESQVWVYEEGGLGEGYWKTFWSCEQFDTKYLTYSFELFPEWDITYN